MPRKLISLLVIWLAAVITYANVFIMPPLLLDFMKTLTISYEGAGLLMTSFALAYAASGIPAGYIASRIGARECMLTGLACILLAQCGISLTQYFPLILGLRGLVGFGAANVWISSVLYIRCHVPSSEWGRALGGLNAGVNAGTALVMAFAPPLAQFRGLALPIQVFALAVLPFLFAVFLLPSVKQRSNLDDSTLTSMPKPGRYWIQVCLLCAMSFAVYFHIYAIFTWVPPFVFETLRADPTTGGLVSSVLALTGIAASVVGGVIADRPRMLHTTVTAGMIVMLSTYFLTAHITKLSHMVLLMLAVGWGSNMALGPLFALPAFVVPPKAAAKTTGLVGTAGFSASIVSTYLGGYILDLTHSYSVILFTVVAVTMIGIISSILLRRSTGANQ